MRSNIKDKKEGEAWSKTGAYFRASYTLLKFYYEGYRKKRGGNPQGIKEMLGLEWKKPGFCHVFPH